MLHWEAVDFWQRKGCCLLYTSYEELLADKDIDLVVVATPNNFHLPLVCQALEAGKLTICEKPVEMCIRDREYPAKMPPQTPPGH